MEGEPDPDVGAGDAHAGELPAISTDERLRESRDAVGEDVEELLDHAQMQITPALRVDARRHAGLRAEEQSRAVVTEDPELTDRCAPLLDHRQVVGVAVGLGSELRVR